jgi:hypothetical protein
MEVSSGCALPQTAAHFVCLSTMIEGHVLCARREKTTKIHHALGVQAIGAVSMLCKSLVQGMKRMKHPTRLLMVSLKGDWKSKKMEPGSEVFGKTGRRKVEEGHVWQTVNKEYTRWYYT